MDDDYDESPERVDEDLRVQVQHWRSAAQSNQAAWIAATRERDDLRRALEGMLRATRNRYGYLPRIFLARVRAEAVLRKLESPSD